MGTRIQNLRKSGIHFIDDLPWGTHISGFYETNQDLIETAVPFLEAGLENNEYCMWIVAEPISTQEAAYVLKSSIPDFLAYLPQIEILSHTEWYLKYGNFENQRVLQDWIDKVSYALSQGYEGFRLCGSTSWLTKKYWKTFMQYEQAVEKAIGSLKMIALCPYQLDKCEILQVLEVVSSHQFSFIKSKYERKYNNSLAKFDRLNLVGKMAASVAHEIRNPMTSVRGFLQLLQSKNQFEDYHDYFKLMLDELDRANDIISEYLSLARNKETKINIQRHNLNKILGALLPLLQADALKENKEVVLTEGNIQDVLVDPQGIRQVVLNMTRNGLEAMPEGGILHIRTRMENCRVVLEFIDSGKGMPEEIINSMGTPFLTTKEHGTGLGLSVCLKILNSFKAHVQVKSSGTGTTFTIDFPAAVDPLCSAL